MDGVIYYFEFEGKQYPYREIFFENRWNNVASTELESKLLDDGCWVSEEARRLDEKIIFFVEPDHLFLKDKDLLEILEENIQ